MLDQLILFGDSITRHAFASSNDSFRFGAALNDLYGRRLDIVHRGVSGYNSSQALHVLPRMIPSPDQAKVRILTIFFGANDARLPNMPGGPDQSVPLEKYEENVRAIVSHPNVRGHAGIRVILITPPPIDERKVKENDEASYPQLKGTIRRTARNAARYAESVRKLGKELNLPVLDIWSEMISKAEQHQAPSEGTMTGELGAPVNTVLQGYLSDGLHFTEEAYRLLFDGLMALIERHYPDQMPERLPKIVPDWDDMAAWEEEMKTT